MTKIIERFHANREKVGEEFARLFEGELNPVAAKAQKKVPIPEGFVLNIFCMLSEIRKFRSIGYTK